MLGEATEETFEAIFTCAARTYGAANSAHSASVRNIKNPYLEARAGGCNLIVFIL